MAAADIPCHERSAPSDEASSDADIFGRLTVGQVLRAGHILCKVTLSSTLCDLSASMVSTGRTAAVAVDDHDELIGLLTENDIMRAYFEDASPEKPLDEWLASGFARAPSQLLRRLIVRPSAPLVDVAERMVTNAIAGDCACHHVVIQEEGGQLFGVLSARDMIKALCCPEMWRHIEFPLKRSEAQKDGHPNVEATAHVVVQDIMKSRDQVFTCPATRSIKDVVKVLLMTQQNCVLIVDEEGVYGLATTTDIVRAFENGVPSSTRIADWLPLPPTAGNKVIAANVALAEAAELMTAQDVDHLVVVYQDSMVAVGLLSALDVVLSVRARSPVLRSIPLWAGPTVGELVGQPWHVCGTCRSDATLVDVAELLMTSGLTSAIVPFKPGGPPQGLLTEGDIMRAYLDGIPGWNSAEEWMDTKEFQRSTIPPHLIVPPTVPLTDAASLMLCCQEPGRTCHHLVLQGADGVWLGVFSALDVARGVYSLCSQLEITKTGADTTTVAMVMKPRDAVPTCKPSDSISDALQKLVRTGQTAVLVFDDEGFHGVITPRCAVHCFAQNTPPEMSVAVWLQSWLAPRDVSAGSRLLEAAKFMASSGLHNLLVRETPNDEPVGVLSSLDVVRGVASINVHCPFVSLGWLRACTVQAAQQGGA